MNTPGYKICMDKYRSTWHYFTQNPQGGGFGSNHCGSKTVALGRALAGIPMGATYQLVTNGKITGQFTKGESQ